MVGVDVAAAGVAAVVAGAVVADAVTVVAEASVMDSSHRLCVVATGARVGAGRSVRIDRLCARGVERPSELSRIARRGGFLPRLFVFLRRASSNLAREALVCETPLTGASLSRLAKG